MLDQLRLESYGCRMRVTTAVSLLGWTGIITSVLAILAVMVVAVLFPLPSSDYIFLSPLTIYECSAAVIIISLLLVILNSFLIKTNRAGRFSGVKSIIRIICSLLLSLQLIASILHPFFIVISIGLAGAQGRSPLPTIFYGPYLLGPLIEDIILDLAWIIFVCIGIHGLRKDSKSLLNTYIIFIILMIIMYIVREFVSQLVIPDVMSLASVILRVLYNIVTFFYNFGFFVILYNMMDVSLEDDQEMKKMLGGEENNLNSV